MKHLRKLVLVAALAATMTALSVVNTASATTLEVGGWSQNKMVQITATISAGSSSLITGKEWGVLDTCTVSQLDLSTYFYSGIVEGSVNSLTLASCTHTTTVLKRGQLQISWTSGTNGSIRSYGLEFTAHSTFFGASAVCKPNSGATIGTLTGTSEGSAKIDINAAVTCGIFGNASWTGTYTVTSPLGLGVTS
jgi:hypothetical protein